MAEHVIHQRGLAVIHVGDDGDVADGVFTEHGICPQLRAMHQRRWEFPRDLVA